MEPATIASIASAAVTALVPYFKKGAEKFADKSTEVLFDKRAEIWGKVKGLFDDDLVTLDLFKENPEDAKTQGKFEGKLEEKLKNDEETTNELDALLKELPALQVKQNTIDIKGDNNIAIQDVSGSRINIK
jgi:hypothetical protein